MRLLLDIDKSGGLYFLLNALIGAYNRRTDMMERTAESNIQARIDALTKDLKTSTDSVETAINETKGDRHGS